MLRTATRHDDDLAGGFHRVEMADGPVGGKSRLVPKLDGPVPGAAYVSADARSLDVDHLHHEQQVVHTEQSPGEELATTVRAMKHRFNIFLTAGLLGRLSPLLAYSRYSLHHCTHVRIHSTRFG